ncbi:oxidoreductase CipA-like protein [Clathrospora elynae]|uniref:Oxidoreductase CipA-like protein n=1 Tax=Clathrospora elynae TaxID=706981 RepID=A0A6A5STI2_9PLEO|nr:oxidoreductase CipA-like protein [Clathrospora elynae]
MPPTKIALAGATGNLGLPILSALLSAAFDVTILTRTTGTNSSKLPSQSNLTIKPVDFTSISSLTPALAGIDVVISCLGIAAMGSQNPLIDAAVAAGVRRFIPADFGMDSQNSRAMQLPVCMMKVDTQTYLREKTEAHPGFSWTAIANGLFLDWGLGVGFIVNPRQHTATLYNGGDVRFSATTMEGVVKAVLGVVGMMRAETANRVVRVHSAVVTQNMLIRLAKDRDGKEWTTSVKSTELVKQESYQELEKGAGADFDAAMLGFCTVAMFDAEYGCDFSGRLDNELLGIEELDEGAVRKLVESFL